MHHFAYRDGVLHAEDISLRRLADEVGTPFYCYSSATLERHYRVFAEAFADTDALVISPDVACFQLNLKSLSTVTSLALLITLPWEISRNCHEKPRQGRCRGQSIERSTPVRS